jgi:hypothetical protein
MEYRTVIYKLLYKNDSNIQILARIDDDNVCRLTCTEHDPEYLKWIEEGNVPTPADEPQA